MGRNYDFVSPHYIHEVLTLGEGDKVILTENEKTKKLLIIQTLDGKVLKVQTYIVVEFSILV